MAAIERLKPLRRKLVIVGDGSAGKTTLFTTMVGRRSPQASATIFVTHVPSTDWPKSQYSPLILENYVHNMEIDGYSLDIAYWETAGQDDYDRLRPLSYPESAIVVICFALNDPRSFLAVSERWYPEVLHFCSKPKVPILLVGCKSDLRRNSKSQPNVGALDNEVAAQDGYALAQRIEAVGYLECSAKTGQGINEVLMKIARVVISWDPLRPRSRRGRCLIL